MKVILINNFVVLPLFLLSVIYIDGWTVNLSFAIEDIPTPTRLAATFLFCMLLDDFQFYFVHRFQHWKYIYPYIHKHHHEYKMPVAMAAEASHPLDFLLAGVISGGLSIMLLGKNMHVGTLAAWSVVRTFEGCDGHSGYEFPWSPIRLLPFSSSAQTHDFHHSHNVGNYSSFFYIWDTIMGTNTAYLSHLDELRKKKSS